MYKTIAAGLALANLFIALPASAQFVGYRSNGTPIFTFRNPSSTIPPGQEVTLTISEEQRNIPVGTANACGYRILTPGSNAQSISQVHPSSGAVIDTSNLPTFTGSCKTVDGNPTLRPGSEGETVPTSHYKTPDNKIAIKIQPDWNYLTITYNNVTRKSKTGACGEVRYAPPVAKEGQRSLSFSDTTITVPGIVNNSNLLNVMQDNKDGFCVRRWRFNSTGTLERVGVFLSGN